MRGMRVVCAGQSHIIFTVPHLHVRRSGHSGRPLYFKANPGPRAKTHEVPRTEMRSYSRKKPQPGCCAAQAEVSQPECCAARVEASGHLGVCKGGGPTSTSSEADGDECAAANSLNLVAPIRVAVSADVYPIPAVPRPA